MPIENTARCLGALGGIGIKGRESIHIEDGKHTGKIAKVEARDVKDFVYLDTFISLDDVICFGKGVSMKSLFMHSVGCQQIIPTISYADVKRQPKVSLSLSSNFFHLWGGLNLHGCPLDLTPNTNFFNMKKVELGKLLMNFGISREKIASGESINIEQVLRVGTLVTLMTQEEKTDRGEFARVIDGSLRPKK